MSWLNKAWRIKNIENDYLTIFFSIHSLLEIGTSQAMRKKPKNMTSAKEKQIIDTILQKTVEHNKNNITRTAAYYQFYKKYPNIHWAHVAHMVSRNGGWNMTDLKGELVTHLMDEEKKEAYFLLLERSNWLIFQDAYPQLLLYEASKKLQTNLFYLLSKLHVSKFMEPIWNLFWQQENGTLITYALIVNEQNYIQKRVVEDAWFQKNVIHTFAFQAQALLHFNLVILPYLDQENNIHLAGTVMKDFQELKERILVGIRLYHILFDIDKIREGSDRWASLHRHTATRADYWPHIFSPQIVTSDYQKQQRNEREGNDQIIGVFSPKLLDVWSEIDHKAPSREDWYTEENSIQQIGTIIDHFPYDMTNKYISILKELDLFNVVKDKMS